MEFYFGYAEEAAGLLRYFYTILMNYGHVSKADLYEYDPSLFVMYAEQRKYTWNFYGWTSTNDISVNRRYVRISYEDMLTGRKKETFVVTLAEPKRLES